jgi:hypothetical protein
MRYPERVGLKSRWLKKTDQEQENWDEFKGLTNWWHETVESLGEDKSVFSIYISREHMGHSGVVKQMHITNDFLL